MPLCIQTAITSFPRSSALLKDLWLELCLVIPARLPDLLPYLGSLMRAMASALLSKDRELVTLALRVLEVWIESIHVDYLYPLMNISYYSKSGISNRNSIIDILIKIPGKQLINSRSCIEINWLNCNFS